MVFNPPYGETLPGYLNGRHFYGDLEITLKKKIYPGTYCLVYYVQLGGLKFCRVRSVKKNKS